MREIPIQPISQDSPMRYGAEQSIHVKTLSSLLEIAYMDEVGGSGSKWNTERRHAINRLPKALTGMTFDAWDAGDITAPRYTAKELLTESQTEGTNLLQEQVERTVTAGAEYFKVIRETNPRWSTVKSNAYRWPLGATQYNAEVVREGAEIPVKTQEYSKQTSSPKKRGVRPPITFEMMEYGEFDVMAEEIFYAGAACENVLNYDSLTQLATNAGSLTTGVGSATAGTGFTLLREAKRRVKGAGFIPDTIIMHTEFESDLMANSNLAYATYAGGAEVVRNGTLPPAVLGMKWFVTDNGHASAVDGSNAWGYAADSEVGALVFNAKQGLGVHMPRDLTVKRFDNFAQELHDVSVTIMFDVKYLQANAICNIEFDTA